MKVHFLEASMPLTKHYTTGSKTPYPNAYEFKSHDYNVTSLEQFSELIKQHADQGHCLLKGELLKQLDWESRAGSTNPHTNTQWICFDLDGMSSINTVDGFMNRMGLGHVSYILQWSASYGINGDFRLRAHIFVFLHGQASPNALKVYLKQANLTLFQSDLSLTKTNNALRWGLDITTCQSDKLIFITPPACDPKSLDHFQGERIVLVEKQVDEFDFSTVAMQSAEQLKIMEQTEINRLRKANNLPERKASQFKMKEYKNELYMPNPDQAAVTGQRAERGFVYFNINGGDSWAYYHPEENPTFIYNFKGEPTYRTSELLPDYWNSLQQTQKHTIRAANKGKIFLAFRDFRSANYYNGWYDQKLDEITLFQAKNEKQLADFLVGYGQPIPDAIPLWEILQDPNEPAFDPNRNRVNLFKFSPFMKQTMALKNTKVHIKPFPAIENLIKHVLGNTLYDHFINWLAFCYQYKIAPKTAVVAHGTQGTGKGLMISEIIVPLFGSWNVSQKRMEELEDRFNDHLESSLIVYVDEAQISDSARSKMIMANIKNQITEPTITIRKMRQSSYEVCNRVGWIFGSNMPDPVTVDIADRRFNVGDYQPNKLKISSVELKQIENELFDFAMFLQQLDVDHDKVRTPLQTEARDHMMQLSQSSADVVAQAILKADLAPLWEALPTVDQSKIPPTVAVKLATYKALIHELVRTKRTKISRDELLIIFDFNVGNIPTSAWKFTSYLRHKNITLKDIRVNDKIVKGMMLEWINSDEWFEERIQEIGHLRKIA
jgi:hypothetical protein